MHGPIDNPALTPRPTVNSTVRAVSRNEIAGAPQWQAAFARERKDRRFYELCEDTLTEKFEYGYLSIAQDGAACAVQPYFVLDQDLVAGAGAAGQKLIAAIRRLSPRFMRARTLMLGCAAGEGHLDGDEARQFAAAELLARALPRVARELNCALIVLKEFPARYRAPLQALRRAGFTRIPSMPMTTLGIGYKDFEHYLSDKLSPRTRAKVRRKLRAAERAQPVIAMQVVVDASPFVDEIYPLYLAVFDRSPLQFEKLTPEFLREIGKRMPDKARFFIWRQDRRIVAFGLCTVQGNDICHEYVGFDYAVAFELNLYYRVFRDIIEWAIANGLTRFYSGSLNYDPKWHLRHSLYPVDLYVRHRSAAINAVLARLLPWLGPTRYDPILPNFENYGELWE